MDNITFPAWIAKVVYAVGIAALLGTGSTILGNAKDVAVLQADSKHVESTVEKRLDRIEDKLDTLIQGGHVNEPSQ